MKRSLMAEGHMPKEEFYAFAGSTTTRCSRCGKTGKWRRKAKYDTCCWLYFECECGSPGIFMRHTIRKEVLNDALPEEEVS